MKNTGMTEQQMKAALSFLEVEDTFDNRCGVAMAAIRVLTEAGLEYEHAYDQIIGAGAYRKLSNEIYDEINNRKVAA